MVDTTEKDRTNSVSKETPASTKRIIEASLPEVQLDVVAALQSEITQDSLGMVIGVKSLVLDMKDRKRIILGRYVAKGKENEMIDLQEYGAHEYGVSRFHASLVMHDGKYILSDLNSRNGTFVEGERLPPYAWRIIESGTKFRLGNLEICLVYTDIAGSFPHIGVELYSRFHTTDQLELMQKQFFPYVESMNKLKDLMSTYSPALKRKHIKVASLKVEQDGIIHVQFIGAEEVLEVIGKVINPDIRLIIDPENDTVRPRADMMQITMTFAKVAKIKEKDIDLLLRNKLLGIISDFAETGLLLK